MSCIRRAINRSNFHVHNHHFCLPSVRARFGLGSSHSELLHDTQISGWYPLSQGSLTALDTFDLSEDSQTSPHMKWLLHLQIVHISIEKSGGNGNLVMFWTSNILLQHSNAYCYRKLNFSGIFIKPHIFKYILI